MTDQRPALSWATLSKLAYLAAIILFILAAVGLGGNLLAWGLAAVAIGLLFA